MGFASATHAVSFELRAIYGADYFHGQENLDYVAEEDSLRLNFHNRIQTLRAFVPNWPQVDAFEIGCAYGFFPVRN